jgi:catechol 2,3-dioxygenase-like lactoylglutathione lyase family enzyme
MNAKYKHANIIARDWRSLAKFYQDVFGCELAPPVRDLQGDWLSKGTGVSDAHITGVHLTLPGYEKGGPTLEIYQYTKTLPKSPGAANREGIMHLAFEVDDVRQAVAEVLRHGGAEVGDITSSEVSGVGVLSFVYVADPEGNLIELLTWK